MEALELQINEFGQTPKQLFRSPHPPRISCADLKREARTMKQRRYKDNNNNSNNNSLSLPPRWSVGLPPREREKNKKLKSKNKREVAGVKPTANVAQRAYGNVYSVDIKL